MPYQKFAKFGPHNFELAHLDIWDPLKIVFFSIVNISAAHLPTVFDLLSAAFPSLWAIGWHGIILGNSSQLNETIKKTPVISAIVLQKAGNFIQNYNPDRW